MRLVWLMDAAATDQQLTGPKAARLAQAAQVQLPVPPGFVVTTRAFEEGMTPELEREIGGAVARLRSLAADGGPVRVAVRSSATAEDLAGASFAGLQRTLLNRVETDEILAAIREVWGSLQSPEARAYRSRLAADADSPCMAVIVQCLVAARAAGVAFARDPLTGEDVIVVEAVAGLGEALVSGEAEPQNWRLVGTEIVARPGEASEGEAAPDDEALGELAELVRAAGELFRAPQDVEWAWDGEQVWLLQARPITTVADDFFTPTIPGDTFLWTAAFLNERFTQPVSPLGWTLVAASLADLAFGEPLRLLGAADFGAEPLLKLRHGHPYSRVAAWQRLYKLFPSWGLPEDAARYFPLGDTSLRHAPFLPQWGLHLIRSGLSVLLREGQRALPWGNPAAWRQYEREHVTALARLRAREEALGDGVSDEAFRSLLRDAQRLADKLLAIHRWSLLWTDLLFTFLRRLLQAFVGREEGTELAAELTGGIGSHTTRLNGMVAALAARANRRPGLREILAHAEDLDDLAARLGARDPFVRAVAAFLAVYGHRSFSLDLFDPPYQAEPRALFDLLLLEGQVRADASQASGGRGAHAPDYSPASHATQTLSRFGRDVKRAGSKEGHRTGVLAPEHTGVGEEAPRTELRALPGAPGDGAAARRRAPSTPWPARAVVKLLLPLARRFLRMREDQRFRWQEILAFQRRVALALGGRWREAGYLEQASHIFGLTWQEALEARAGSDLGRLAAARFRQLQRLRRQAARAPGEAYPDFLRGSEPLRSPIGLGRLTGRPVSPGVARGRARLVASADDLERLELGDVLVTASPDPGWTPAFGVVAALVTERGGQLSHGAVIAREYGLPAVFGVGHAMRIIREGEELIVDGTQGLVARLSEDASDEN